MCCGFCCYSFVLLSLVPGVQQVVCMHVYVCVCAPYPPFHLPFLLGLHATDRGQIHKYTDRRLPTFSSLDASSWKPCGTLLPTFHLHFYPAVRCHPLGDLPLLLLVYPCQAGTAYRGSPAWCLLHLLRHCAKIICLPINLLAR